MKVFVPEDFARGGLPDDVESRSARRPGVEFAVPTSLCHGRAARRRCPTSASSRSSPRGSTGSRATCRTGVTLCNAGDTRSPAVAQWVVAAILADLGGFRARGPARLGALAAARARGQARGDRRPRLDRARGRAAAGAVRRALRPRGARRRGRGSSRSSGSPTRSRAPTSSSCSRRSRTRRAGSSAREVIGRMQDGALLVNAGRGAGRRHRRARRRAPGRPDPGGARRHRPRAAARGSRPVDARRRLPHARTTPATRRRPSAPRRRWRARRCCATARAYRSSTWSGRVRRAAGAGGGARTQRVAGRAEREHAGEDDRQLGRADRVGRGRPPARGP